MKMKSSLAIVAVFAACAVTVAASADTPIASVRPPIGAAGKFGTPNIDVAVDSRWTNYGAYLQRLLDTVQAQWDQSSAKIGSRPQSSKVIVTFVLNARGEVHILKTEPTATDQASNACVSGITARAPYGLWSQAMKTDLGAEQTMVFTFFYR